MSKKSKITNLLVIPLIGSAILLANPVLASNNTHPSENIVRHKTNLENPRPAIAGTVTSINGNIIIVTTKGNIQYTVDASNANIMKASEDSTSNPTIVTISDIKIGDAIFVRGQIDNTEINADKIFDGKLDHKHFKHHRDGKHFSKKH